MSWELRTDITPKPHPAVQAPPQAVFEIHGAGLVALAISTTPTPATTLVFDAACWLVDDQGDPQGIDHDADGTADAPILSRFTHAADAHQITTLGVQGIAAALRDLLLGEPAAAPPVIPWADQLRAQVSIRNVITVATAAGTPIDWSAA